MADIQYMRSKESFAASFLLDRFNIRILLRNTPDLLTEINIRCKQCLVILPVLLFSFFILTFLAHFRKLSLYKEQCRPLYAVHFFHIAVTCMKQYLTCISVL